jgi:hypothetical protein
MLKDIGYLADVICRFVFRAIYSESSTRRRRSAGFHHANRCLDCGVRNVSRGCNPPAPENVVVISVPGTRKLTFRLLRSTPDPPFRDVDSRRRQ